MTQAQLADAGNCGQELDRGAKGLDVSVDLLIDVADRRVDGIDLLQMQAQQEAVVAGDAAAQRFAKGLGWRLDPAVGQPGQGVGIAFSSNQRLDHRPTAEAHDVRDDRVELDVGVLQRLLQPLDMAAAFAHQLLAGAQQVAHLLGLLIGHETAADQAGCQKIGQPGGVVDVGLAPWHVLDMRCVRQHQGEIAVAQHMPHRLPVDAGRFHRNVGASFLGQPLRQGEQIPCRRLEGTHVVVSAAVILTQVAD